MYTFKKYNNSINSKLNIEFSRRFLLLISLKLYLLPYYKLNVCVHQYASIYYEQDRIRGGRGSEPPPERFQYFQKCLKKLLIFPPT